jgi:BirA family biotin operon repressor/biotin-[acetyl-CoA-carboxylase] ligase
LLWLFSNVLKGYNLKIYLLNGLTTLYADKKIGGILIENVHSKNGIYSIIGVGLNINQIDFENLPQASSIKQQFGLNWM